MEALFIGLCTGLLWFIISTIVRKSKGGIKKMNKQFEETNLNENDYNKE